MLLHLISICHVCVLHNCQFFINVILVNRVLTFLLNVSTSYLHSWCTYIPHNCRLLLNVHCYSHLNIILQVRFYRPINYSITVCNRRLIQVTANRHTWLRVKYKIIVCNSSFTKRQAQTACWWKVSWTERLGNEYALDCILWSQGHTRVVLFPDHRASLESCYSLITGPH